MNIIESKDNKKIKFLKMIRDDSKERLSNSLFFVEGERNINDIDPSLIYEVYIKDGYDGKLPKVEDSKIYKVKDNVFNDIKDTVTSQGIIALVKLNNSKIESVLSSNKILILDNIQDPGNMGTIIRTAEATSFNSIILANNCVDAFSPKVIRSSMSAITRINIYKTDNVVCDIKYLKDNDYKIIGTFLDTDKIYTDNLYDKNVAIVIGNEANGISTDIKSMCDYKVKIPMSGKIESLNASVAAAIMLYEVKRHEFIS